MLASRPSPLYLVPFGLAILAALAAPSSPAQTASNPPLAAVPATVSAAAAALPSAGTLMQNLLARLPSKPVLITGDLVTSSESSAGKERLGVGILLCYPSLAQYTILDSFGRAMEQLTLKREAGQVQFAYQTGDPLTNAPAPKLGARIQDTALSWVDLTLSFVWWPEGRTIGREEIRGQPCYVVDRRPGPGDDNSYGSVRLWIDTRVSMLLQAEGSDRLGDLRRRLLVKSFKKINDEWMIKDLEFDDLQTGTKTVLKVKDAKPVQAAP